MVAQFLRVTLGLLYPLLVYGALHYFSPRIAGLFMAAVFIIRYRRPSGMLWQGLAQPQKWMLGLLVITSLGVSVLNSEPLLRLLPALISLSMLFLFGFTLRYPPSMIERFARLITPDLPAGGVIYTRRVTMIWCVFFVLNASIALWTAWYVSRETWLFYNGFLSYVFMGILFAGEWLYRRWRFPQAV